MGKQHVKNTEKLVVIKNYQLLIKIIKKNHQIFIQLTKKYRQIYLH